LVNSESNASDYSLLSTSGDGGSVPGVPGPLDLAAPVVHNNILQSSLVDPNVSANASPNFVYTASAQIVDINRTLTNCSGNQSSLAVCVNAQSGTTAQTVTRLQFRVTGLTTGVLLAESSSSGAFPDANNTSYPVSGLSLSTPAGSTAGLNAVLVGTSDLPSGGLAPGASISVDFRFAVVAHGPYTFAYNAEDDLEAYSAATTSEPTATSSALSPVISPPSADSDSPVAASSDATPIAQTTSGAINASSATATVTPAAKSAAAIQKVIKRHGVKKKATKRHVKKHTTKKHAVKRKRTRQHGIERGTTKSHAARKAAGSKIAESTTVS
jgi:hypothetical protein